MTHRTPLLPNHPLASALTVWIMVATRGLRRETVARISSEVEGHAVAAFESCVAGGRPIGEAVNVAMVALGSASQANRIYRRAAHKQWVIEIRPKLVIPGIIFNWAFVFAVVLHTMFGSKSTPLHENLSMLLVFGINAAMFTVNAVCEKFGARKRHVMRLLGSLILLSIAGAVFNVILRAPELGFYEGLAGLSLGCLAFIPFVCMYDLYKAYRLGKS